MFLRHRAGISLGLVITVLGAGFFGYILGANAPASVFGLGNHPSVAPCVGAASFALFAGIIWSVGEIIVGLVGAVGRDATLVRLGVSLIGSFISVTTAGLSLLNIQLFHADPHSIFAYGPLAGGLGSIALGAHALLHQIHLDRFMRQS
jgi:hypothetical protein